MTEELTPTLDLLYGLLSRIARDPSQRLRIIQEFCSERASAGDMETAHIVLLMREILREERPAAINIENMKGDLNMPESINIHDVVGPVNVKSRLDRVTQIVNSAGSLQDNNRAELAKLLQELQSALAPVEPHQPQDAERVVKSAEMVADEVTREKPSQSFLGIALAGLTEAAKSVQAIAPTVVDIVDKIVKFIGGLF